MNYLKISRDIKNIIINYIMINKNDMVAKFNKVIKFINNYQTSFEFCVINLWVPSEIKECEYYVHDYS